MTILVGQEKPTLEDIEHFGVKGMKWGVRKDVPRADGYSDSQRAADRKKYGRNSDRRVDKRVAKGKDLKEARAREQHYVRNRNLMIAGSYMALKLAPIALAAAGAAANSLAVSYVDGKTAQAGAAHAAKMFSDSRGIGAQRVITLDFDADSGVFR